MDELARASSGPTMRQLACGDAAEATKHIRQLLKLSRHHAMIATENTPQDVVGPRRLKDVPIKIFETHIQALLDTGAVPNLVSRQLCEQLCVKPEKSEKSIKVADGSMAPTCENLKEIPIFFGGHPISLDFLVVYETPVDMIIGSPTLEKLEARIDMGHSYVTATIDGVDVQLSFEYTNRKAKSTQASEETDSDAFISDDGFSSYYTGFSQSDDEGAFVATIRDDLHSKED